MCGIEYLEDRCLCLLRCLNACRLFADAPSITNSSTSGNADNCTNCGVVKKSGKRSCCARGGAWFQNCGDNGNTNFDHTWSEGIQACKGWTSSISFESTLRAMSAQVGAYSQNVTKRRNAEHRISMYTSDAVFETIITGSEECVRPTQVDGWILIVCLILQLQI